MDKVKTFDFYFTSRIYTNIPKDELRLSKVVGPSGLSQTRIEILNPKNGDVVVCTSTHQNEYEIRICRGGEWAALRKEENGIFKISIRSFPQGFSGMAHEGRITFMDSSVLEFISDEWVEICDLLGGKISVQEFLHNRLLAEMETLRKRVDELGKLAGTYDTERRRFAEAMSTAARGLYDTRRFVKSSRIQKIREDLEVALRG